MANWQSFLLQRLAGRLRIDDDIVRGAAQIQPDWVWPFWVERQLDPGSPDFTPRGHLPFLSNVTHRNWTMVGNLGSPSEAIVDPRGLVTPWFDGWSLDWWVGAEDRWHLPSRETAVRQSLLDSAPVVETAMRIPGGDAVQRVYAVIAPSAHPPLAELVVVEVENRSATPVAVAFALRPYNPEGLAVVERIAMAKGEHGETVLADGRPALLLPRAPSGVAAGTFVPGDSAGAVFAGRAAAGPFAPVKDPAGLAQAAFVYPVPHHSTVRVAVPLVRGPLVREHRARRQGPARRRVEAFPGMQLGRLPKAADVARGWQAQLNRGMRVTLPDNRLQAAVDANRAYLLLFHGAYLLAALDRYGFHAEAAEVLRSYPRRQQADGFFLSQRREWDANGAAIWAIAEHHRLTGDAALLDELLPAVGKGARWIARKRKEGGYYWDDFWSLRGLLDAGWLLRLGGDRAAAADAEQAAGELRATILTSLDLVAARLGRAVMPAGPRRGIDAGMIGSLVACTPLGLLAPTDPLVANSLDVLRDRFCLGEAFFQSISHTGLGTYLTLQIAACELEGENPRAWRRLRWMLDAATPTFTWPEAIHPRLGGGCMGDGHHGWAAADFLSFIRQVLVRETRSGELALLTILPPEWAGQNLEVHEAPTHHGHISYAVRWHGDRPALLWECEREGVRLTVPGLDRSWSTTEHYGEALLEPYRRRVPLEVE